MLNYARVHAIRTSGKTDRHYARLWKMTDGSIRDARVGRTWPDHPTKPDETRRHAARSRPSLQATAPRN